MFKEDSSNTNKAPEFNVSDCRLSVKMFVNNELKE